MPARRRKILFWVAGILAAYTLIGFFVVPLLIKWQLVKQLPAITKRQVSVRQVKVNPLTLSLTIRNLALREPDGALFASFEEFYVNFQASSLFRWAWTFKELRLVQPFGEVILMENGQLNFSNMFPVEDRPPSGSKTESGGIPRVNIFHLQLTNGCMSVQDRTRRSKFATEYKPINFVFSDFSTRPDSETPYSFRAESGGGRSFAWKGDFSVQPLKSSGRFELTGLSLAHYHPYIEDFTRVVVTNGVVDIELTYRFAAGTNGIDLIITNGTLALSNLDVRDPDTSEMVAGLNRFEASGAELNLREKSARLKQIVLSDPSVLGRIKKDGNVNLLDLMPQGNAAGKPAETNSPSSEPWALAVDQVSVTNAGFVFEDLSRSSSFKTEIKLISFALAGFNTRPGSNALYRFHLETESAENLAGTGTVCANPPASHGEVVLQGLDLKKYLPYAEHQFTGNISSGKLDVRAPYRFALSTNGISAGVSNLAVTLAEVELTAGEESVTRVDRLELQGIEASLEDRRARVGLVSAAGGYVLVRRANDGTINLQKLVSTLPEKTNNTSDVSPVRATAGIEVSREAGESGTPGSPPAWSVVLDELDVTGYTLRIEDQQPARPGAFLLEDVALSIKGASTDRTVPITAQLGLRLNGTGTVDIRGKTTVEPLFADVNLGMTNIDLKSVQPYLDTYANLAILSGSLSTHGAARYQAEGASFSGDVYITKFSCTDTLVAKEFARWEDLRISGIAAELAMAGEAGNKVKIANITWSDPKTTVVIAPDGKLNLPQLAEKNGKGEESQKVADKVAGATAEQGAPVAPSQAAPPLVEIDTITMEKGSFGFSDLSVKPNSSLGVENLGGTIKGISSALNTTATVNLSGTVGEQAPFSITGQVNPLGTDLFMDLVISNSNAQLSPLTGYMEKYAGHPLNKGRLSTSLHYVIEKKELKAENKIQIDQLTLGPRNDSPDATSLPVRLGVALLKDSNGRIDLNVPVTGRLDDPQFRVGPIILKVVVNMLVKAATSPFKMLGALVGGGEEMSFVEFSPGTSEASAAEVEKLQKLQRALAARPALNVEIEGHVDPKTDRHALAVAKLRQDIKRTKLEELSGKGKTVETIETFQMESAEYDRMLRRRFVDQFGTNIMVVLQSNLVAQAQQAKEAADAKKQSKSGGLKGIFISAYKATVEFIGIGPGRSPAEKRLTKAERAALGQATPEMMERLLADTSVAITPEQYQSLMKARAQWVQEWLLQSGGVAAERLLLVAPKTVNDAYQGQSRAVMTLN